jgi:hypothetical protein
MEWVRGGSWKWFETNEVNCYNGTPKGSEKEDASCFIPQGPSSSSVFSAFPSW